MCNVCILLKVRYVSEVMNRQDYVPKTPGSQDLDLIYDVGFDDVQPYLFKVNKALSKRSF